MFGLGPVELVFSILIMGSVFAVPLLVAVVFFVLYRKNSNRLTRMEQSIANIEKKLAQAHNPAE